MLAWTDHVDRSWLAAVLSGAAIAAISYWLLSRPKKKDEHWLLNVLRVPESRAADLLAMLPTLRGTLAVCPEPLTPASFMLHAARRESLAPPKGLVDMIDRSSCKNAVVLAACDMARSYQDICAARIAAAALRTPAGEMEDSIVPLLQRLWAAAGKGAPFVRVGEHWNTLGFQGRDPATDLRGGHLHALEDFVFLAEHRKELLSDMMTFVANQHESGGASWFLPACVSIQVSVLLSNAEVAGISAPVNVQKKAEALTIVDSMIQHLYAPLTEAHVKVSMRRRLHELHAAHLTAFFELWKRDMPFIMEHQRFMQNVFFPSAPMIVTRILG